MNNLRTLLLIPVFFIQITGFMMSRNSESFRSFELSENRTQEIKRQASTIDETPSKNLQLFKKDGITCENTPICRKETPLRCEVQSVVIPQKRSNPSVKKASVNNQRAMQKSSVMSKISFNGTVSAILY